MASLATLRRVLTNAVLAMDGRLKADTAAAQPSHRRAKVGVLNLDHLVTRTSQRDEAAHDDSSTASDIAALLKGVGGRREDRTPGLRVANAALSQLS